MDAANMRRKMLKPLSRNYNHQLPYNFNTNTNQSTNNLSIETSYNVMFNTNTDKFEINKQKQSPQKNRVKNKNSVLEVYGSQHSQNVGSIGQPQGYVGKQFLFHGEYGGYIWIVEEFQIILQRMREVDGGGIQLAMEQVLGKYQSQTISKTLTNLLTKKTMKNQTKIQICSELMIACLALIKSYNRNSLYRIISNPFKLVNNINRSLLEYLKSKYPKKKGLAVPHGLDDQFEKIDYLGMFQNDMLANSGFSFTGSGDTRVEILDKTKKYLNCLLVEVEENFQYFTKMLNRVFTPAGEEMEINFYQENGQIIERQTPKNPTNISSSKIKISRKLPQTTQKFYEFGTENMQISSPQLFRVMTKWIQGMQQLLINPQDIINNMTGIKYIKKYNIKIQDELAMKGYGNYKFDEIQSKRFEALKIDLIEKITEVRDKQYNKEIGELLEKLNNFNDTFLRILTIRSPKAKFIEQEQAQSLKFSKYNAKFLQWLIMQKFIILVKILSNLSAHFETKLFKQLDFINFNVFDLMRGSFSGKKEEVVQAFKNLRAYEIKNQIEIIRVKNRLHTPLNDVLINFKPTKSFIVCQLQLILIDLALQGQEKLKYVQDLNHILYELERSPYGSLSEMALIVDHFDPTIFYQRKITFSNDWFTDQICRQSTNHKHQFIQIKPQLTPFVCAWCVKFYSRLQNYFQYHKCLKCGLQKCKACVFRQNPSEERRIYFRNFAMAFLGIRQNVDDYEELKDDQFVDNFFLRQETNFISDQYIKVSDLVNVQNGAKIETIQKFLHESQKQYGLKPNEPFYCFLLKFSNQTTQLKLLKYQNYIATIVLQQDQQDLTMKQLNILQQNHKKIKLYKHDVLFLLKKRMYMNQKQGDGTVIIKSRLVQVKNLYYLTNSHKRVCIPNKKLYRAVYILHKKKKYSLELRRYQNQQSINQEQQMGSEEFQYNKLQLDKIVNKIISKCKGYKLQRYCMELQNLGITQSDFIRNLAEQEEEDLPVGGKIRIKAQWVKQVYIFNVSQNYIKNIDALIHIFPNLKELYLSKNLITSMKFILTCPNLKILDISRNLIKQIPHQQNTLKNLQNLVMLQLSANLIEKIPSFNLPQLQQLYLNKNKITNFQPLFESRLVNLEILDISLNTMAGRTKINWQNFANFPKLRKFQGKKINLVTVQQHTGNKQGQNPSLFSLKYLPKIQYLQLSNNKLGLLNPLTQRKLRQIKMCYCQLKNINNVFTTKLINLQLIQFQSNQISQFPPELELPQLKTLKLTSNKMKTINNIKTSNLPKLQQLELQSNAMKDVSQLQFVQFLSLKRLLLEYNYIQEMPVLRFCVLEELNLNNNKLKDISSLSKSELPCLKIFLFKNNKLQTLPHFQFQNLIQITPFSNQLIDLTEFSKSNLPKITKLNFHHNKLTQLKNQLNFPTISSLLIYQNQLTNVSGLQKSNLKNLKMISLNANKIIEFPILELENLQIFNAARNCLQNIDTVNKWKTPKLRILDLKYNKIKKMPGLKDLPIQTIDLSNNLFEDLQQFSSESRLPMLRKIVINNIKKLTRIGGNFSGCQRLEDIMINSCALENFDEFANTKQLNTNKLKYLRILNFDYNRITHFPPSGSLDYLQSLQRLILRYNKIEKLDYQLQGLKSLKYLYLSTNNICNIEPQYVHKHDGLVELSLSRNPIKVLKFQYPTKLKSLTLNHCGITDGVMEGLELPELKELFLIKNQLESMSIFTVLGAFGSLKKLFLEENKIKVVPALNLPHLNELILMGNPFTSVAGLLTSYFPQIKLVLLAKRKKNGPRNKNAQISNKQMQQELVSKIISQELKSKDSKDSKESNNQQQEEQEDEEGLDEIEKKNSSTLTKMEEKPSILDQIKKVSEEFKKLYPNAMMYI